MKTYHLASHAFARVSEGHAFMLDLRKDDYLGFRDSTTLHREVNGWPVETSPFGTVNLHEDVVILEGLHAQGLVTTNEAACGAGFRFSVEPPRKDWSNAWLDAEVSIKPLDFYRFVMAYAETLMWWRRPMEQRVTALRERMADRRENVEREGDDVRYFTAIFLRLRPWFYSADEECLFDTFVLVNFLWRCGYFVFLVIGVAARPFKAHAWAQFRDIALNELDARARKYDAILVV